MDSATIIKTPLVTDALSHLRDKTTAIDMFRFYADSISFQILSVVFSEDDLLEKEMQTPLTKTKEKIIAKNFVFVTVLRAGLAMLPAMLRILPGIPVGFLGIKRDEKTAVAREYYCNLPRMSSDTIVIVADPMLATGGSMIDALEKITALSPKEIRVVSIISAPEGIEAVRKKFPKIHIITAAVDSHLNDKKYIVPGLGDFGDRYFATE